MFVAALTAWVVCGCIFTRKPRKKLPAQTLRAAVSDERQSGCFALEEERGTNWTGTSAPVIKETRPLCNDLLTRNKTQQIAANIAQAAGASTKVRAGLRIYSSAQLGHPGDSPWR
jgi:L-2-hydroxyglutarate oxidase LhgO